MLAYVDVGIIKESILNINRKLSTVSLTIYNVKSLPIIHLSKMYFKHLNLKLEYKN